MQKQITVLIIFLSMVFLMNAATLINETFSAPSADWTIQGYSVGTPSGHAGPGTLKVVADMFKTDVTGSFLRLTENEDWQRAWAYYTPTDSQAPKTFPMMEEWTITMDVRIEKRDAQGNAIANGADGLCFIFADASTCTTNGALDMAKVEGGWGEFEGTPRGFDFTGNGVGANAKGYHAGFKGFSLEFDHYNNNPEAFREYIHWVDLATWIHSGLPTEALGNMGPDPDFYFNNGWQRVKIAAKNGVIKFIYGWDGTSYTKSFTFDAKSPTADGCTALSAYDAYLGIGAATGGESAFHDVRNFKLEDSYDDTLPVELSSFNVFQNSNNFAQINWATQSESNLGGYHIVRNTERDLQTAQIISPLIGATNTSEPQYYQFNDSGLTETGTYYYWLQVSEYDGETNYHGPIHLNYVLNNNQGTPGIPLSTAIGTIYPNPFNPSTTIDYGLLKDADVLFTIYDLKGRVVRTINENHKTAGNWKIIWNGTDDNGVTCPSGAYFVKMQAGNVTDIRKAILMK